MKKGFPNKFLCFPVGWKDLGKVRRWSEINFGRTSINTKTHAICQSRVRIGKEGKQIFVFCPRCLTKTNDF